MESLTAPLRDMLEFIDHNQTKIILKYKMYKFLCINFYV